MDPMPHGPPYLREASSSLLHNRRQRDKALLVGLEYGRKGDDAVPPLPGIHEDIHCFREYLIKHELYWPNNITVLLDDGMDDTQGIKSVADDSDLYRLNKPNRKTILREFRRLVEGMREGDCRILLSKSFAGHGAQLINLDGTEEDERDEVFIAAGNGGFPPSQEDAPLLESPEDIGRLPENHDFYKVLKGLILDNEFRKELVDAIPPGSQLVAIVETCHSGTLLDLDSMKPEEVHVDDEVHGCGNPAKDISKVLSIGKMRKFIRRQVRRMTVAAVAPVVLVHNSLPLRRIRSKPARRDSSATSSTPLNTPKVAQERAGTWDESCSSGRQQMRGRPELACVISFSSSQDSQRTMAGGPCQSMIQIMMNCLKSEPATGRSKSARIVHQTVCDEMYQQRLKVISEGKGPRFNASKLLKKLQEKQKPQLSTLKTWARNAEGQPALATDTTLDEVLEL